MRRRAIKQRIITALIALPILIGFIAWSSVTVFAAVIAVVSLLALKEFYAMSLPDTRQKEQWAAMAAGAVLVPVWFSGNHLAAQAVFTVLVLGFSTAFLFRFKDIYTVTQHVGLVALGWLYVPLLLTHLVYLRAEPFGRAWVFLVLLVVMACDSFAYFTGISIGKHKLYPAISPKKSIEGAVGGLFGAVLGAFVARWTFFPELGLLDCIALGLVLGVFGQVGDLFESMLKRSFGVKDSGTLIPGHGGLLDRLDSLLFVFPLAFYYAHWFFAA